MIYRVILATLGGLLLFSSHHAAASNIATPIDVAVPADVYRDYQCWIGERDVLTVNDYAGKCLRRDVVELALLQQALNIGGSDVAPPYIHWIIINSYDRTLVELAAGRIALSATSAWLTDIEAVEGITASAPLLAAGSNIGQLYGSAELASRLHLHHADQLAQWRITSAKQWRKDWRVLSALPHGALLNANNWQTMVRWVNSGRADLLLAPPLPHGQDVLSVGNTHLHPVRGGLLCLPGSRHFPVSLPHPESAELLNMLQTGLAALRESGKIQQAYRDAGLAPLKQPLLNRCH